MPKFSIGKIRGLQQVADVYGTFTVLAMDHRDSFKKMIRPDGAVSYEETVARKVEMCSLLAPYAGAVLLDPIYGAAQCLQQGALPGSKGLLVSIEESGYGGGKENRVTRLLDDWSVKKIKLMGASAVKILVYYRPDLKELARQQLAVVQAVAEDCRKWDIPFFVEPVSYPVGDEVNDPALFARRKPEIVLETARQMTSLPIDVLKAEFPADMRYEKDKKTLLRWCRELDAASRTPWVLLSAGVDIETFAAQVEIACQAGAAGFLGGRAIWQEVMPMKDGAARKLFYKNTVVPRMQLLSEIVHKNGRPWYKKYGVPLAELTDTSEDWLQKY